MLHKLYFFSLLVITLAFSQPAYAQCPNLATIELLTQNGAVVNLVGTTETPPLLTYVYIWNFGDGNSQTGQFVSHVYSQPGVFVINLNVYDSLQTSTCFSGVFTVVIEDQICDFNPSFTINDLGTGAVTFGNVQFQNAQLPVTYSWQFSNGFQSNTPNPTLTFNNGNYDVCLTVMDATGCTDTVCNNFTVTDGPCLNNFLNVQANVNQNQMVLVLTSNSTPAFPIDVYISFGDGTSQNGIMTSAYTASHIYSTQSYYYNYCVIGTDANGCIDTLCQTITLAPCSNLDGQINANTNGLEASFTSTITGGCGNYTYLWNIQNQQFTSPSPIFTFSGSGVYQVYLTITDSCGCTQNFSTTVSVGCFSTGGPNVPIQNGANTLCSASFTDAGGPFSSYQNNENYTFTIFPSTPNAKIKVAFTSFNTEANYDYLKIYDGASVNANQLANLTGTINNPFNYVSTSNDGALTFKFTSDASVVFPGWIAQISCSDLNINTLNLNDGNWQISASSGQTWASLSWTIDGVPFNQMITSFTYPFTEGQHQVCLTATNALGCTEQTCTNINVPCTYNISLLTEVIGNQVNLTIDNFNPSYYYSLQGNQNWQQITSANTILDFITGGVQEICVFSDGVCFDSTCVNVDLGNANTSEVSGIVWNDANGNGLFDEGELPFSNVYVVLCQEAASPQDSTSCIWAITDENGAYSFNIFPGNYTITSQFWQQLFLPTFPVGGGGYQFTVTGENNISGFDFGYQNQAVTISGTVFYDSNNNGIQDIGETGAAYKSLQIGNYWTSTNANGNYSLNVVPGNYVVSLTNPGIGYIITVPVSPNTYSVNATNIGSNYNGNNFGLWADPNLIDLSADIHQISTVTPGFPVMTYLSYCNNGVAAQSGTFTYYWDAQLAISSPTVFNPAPTIFNAISNSASWNFTNLAPGACSYIYQNVNAPVTLVLGTPVINTVIVTPINDSYPLNNIDTLHQTVVGSWDPNDKQGVPNGVGETGKILPNTRLDYTIRFQNTGTAPAVNVVLIDTISADFILETFTMNTSSDNYTVNINQQTRVIRWTFNNIMLPDSTSDPIGSIGFVNFSISPVQNQVDGTVLNNFADIYFDFNEPIRTNTTIHTIDRFLSIDELKTETLVNVFPNPFSGTTQFLVNTSDRCNATIIIYNVLGEIVTQIPTESGKTMTFDATGKASGVYFYKVISKQSEKSGKLIVR